MPRYMHFMEKASGGKWPGRVVCLDCVPGPPTHQKGGVRGVESLAYWHAVFLSGSQGKYGPEREMTGSSAAGLWEELASLTSAGGNVWVVSHFAQRQWAMLNLWQRLEMEDLELVGDDDRAPDRPARASRKLRREATDPLAPLSAGALTRDLDKTSGYMVLEDTPNIVKLRVKGCRGWLTWIDIRNYGIEAGRDAASGAYLTAWLADTFRRVASTLVRYKLGSLQATAGSQAFHGWRAGYLDTGVYCHNEPRGIAIEGDAYYGGRCEPYRLGVVATAVWHADYRSCYAYVCQQQELPTRLIGVLDSISPEAARQYLDRFPCIARVAVETREPAYPVRRERQRADSVEPHALGTQSAYAAAHGDVVFPIGRFHTTLCGPELRDALDKGRVKWVQQLAWYQGAYALRSYANALYQLREDAEHEQDVEIATLAKRLLVALPGKLGQRDRRWVVCPNHATDMLYGEWWGSDPAGQPCRYRAVSGLVQRDTLSGFAHNACPAMAAYVTSAGRLRLLDAIRAAGWANTYYVDTDSVVVNDPGFERLCSCDLVADKTLGYLSVKCRAYRFEIRGIKHYVEDGKLVCSGLPKGQCEDAGDGKHYYFTEHARSMIRRGDRPEVRQYLREYDRLPAYHHGTVNADGSISPLILKEW